MSMCRARVHNMHNITVLILHAKLVCQVVYVRLRMYVFFSTRIVLGALLAAEHVKGSVNLSVEEGKDTKLHVSE